MVLGFIIGQLYIIYNCLFCTTNSIYCFFFFLLLHSRTYVNNISTKEKKTKEDPRVLGSYEEKNGTEYNPEKTSKRKKEIECVDMIQKKYRLGADFFRTHKKPEKKIAHSDVDILIFPSSRTYSRYACVIKKGIFSSHVSRNQYRRSFFSYVSEKKLYEKITKKDIVVIIKKPTETTLKYIINIITSL